MLHHIHIPRFPLNEFVEVFVYFKGVQHEHNVDRFLPNGDTEILIDLYDRPQFIYDNQSLKEIQACNRVWASGLRTEPITIPSGNDSEMVVISFKKGRAAPFFPFPMHEITDSVVDADLIWGSALGSLREQLIATAAPEDKFRIVEDFLLNEFRSTLAVDKCVLFAVEQMRSSPDDLNIAVMNNRIGYSQKHFIDMFKRAVGITPKAYLKIMRFQKAVQTIDSSDDHDWGQIALECGFYDQSHFINDFKHFSGFTPEQFSAISTNYQNYIPVG